MGTYFFFSSFLVFKIFCWLHFLHLNISKMKLGAIILLVGVLGVTAEEKDTAFLAAHEKDSPSLTLEEVTTENLSAEIHNELSHDEHIHDAHSHEEHSNEEHHDGDVHEEVAGEEMLKENLQITEL